MKKSAFLVLGLLAFVASGVMFVVGSNSGHLSELRDAFWVPIPLGIALIGLGTRS